MGIVNTDEQYAMNVKLYNRKVNNNNNEADLFIFHCLLLNGGYELQWLNMAVYILVVCFYSCLHSLE